MKVILSIFVLFMIAVFLYFIFDLDFSDLRKFFKFIKQKFCRHKNYELYWRNEWERRHLKLEEGYPVEGKQLVKHCKDCGKTFVYMTVPKGYEEMYKNRVLKVTG